MDSHLLADASRVKLRESLANLYAILPRFYLLQLKFMRIQISTAAAKREREREKERERELFLQNFALITRDYILRAFESAR